MNFEQGLKTVFVLGAGFTRSFVSNAPLLRMKVGVDRLEERFRGDDHIMRIISRARDKDDPSFLQVETLLSRASEQMPYDQSRSAQMSRLADVTRQILIEEVKKAGIVDAPDPLTGFAKWCVKNRAHCISFNYDLVLDEALHHVRIDDLLDKHPRWAPRTGYGFFLRLSGDLMRGPLGAPQISSTKLLKLHGSLNWFPLHGTRDKVTPSTVVCHCTWPGFKTAKIEGIQSDALPVDDIAHHLEPDPFIVPPISSKERFYREPLLSLIWNSAFEYLKDAQQVVFIGFSLPESDRTASALFSESITDSAKVHVVGYSKDEDMVKRYSALLPEIAINQHWGGGLDFIKDHVLSAP